MMVLGQYSIAQVMVDAWWYWVSSGRYWLVLGIQSYWVNMGLLCLYILKKVYIWSDVTIAGQTNQQTNK